MNALFFCLKIIDKLCCFVHDLIIYRGLFPLQQHKQEIPTLHSTSKRAHPAICTRHPFQKETHKHKKGGGICLPLQLGYLKQQIS